LYQQVFQADEIQGDVMYHFAFPAIAGSAGQPYYFELAAPDAVAGNAITAYVQPTGGYSDVEVYFAGRLVPGDLVSSQAFQVNGWERLRIWLRQVAAAKPGIWGQGGGYVLLGLAYLAVSGVLFWRLRPGRTG
jgi:hypothetical protein